MVFFMNPFAKHDVSDFPGVLIPLQQADRHASVVTAFDEKMKLEGGADSPTVDSEGKPGLDANYSPTTLEGLRVEIDEDIGASGHDTAYDRTCIVFSRLVPSAVFIVIWSLSMNQRLSIEHGNSTYRPDDFQANPRSSTKRYKTLGWVDINGNYSFSVVLAGWRTRASVWGIASDVIGRRLAFNATLFLAGVFGLAVGGGPNWVGTAGLFAALGTGVGGNLPVDGALFLEFLPFASGGLLTMLSVWWPVGQLIASLSEHTPSLYFGPTNILDRSVAWGFIPNYSCAADLKSCNQTPAGAPCCTKASNMGWRYFVITLGALTFCMFICRFFLFHLFESPKFLLSRGRQAEAVATVHGIAYKNKRQTWLTVDILNAIGGDPEVVEDHKLSTTEIVKRQLGKFSTERIGPLFGTKKLGINTALIWFCWATIGMGYPLFNAFLPQYLKNSGKGVPETPTNIVYRNYAITSIVGVPGSMIAYYTVDIKYIGRKGTMAISTCLSGIFLYLFTLSSDPKFQVAFSSLEAFFQNVMYGVLYAYTPECFPAPNRGTGTGIASFLNRIAGLCAPLVAIYGGSASPSSPVYAAGGLFLAAFVAMCLLPIETRGKQSL
ncbi:MAG: hypothetical protein M1812_003635 [Candelaria pacifica]|nr:MAG: hypothetical protein M1812_003635 [Candelaria pacifica]